MEGYITDDEGINSQDRPKARQCSNNRMTEVKTSTAALLSNNCTTSDSVYEENEDNNALEPMDIGEKLIRGEKFK